MRGFYDKELPDGFAEALVVDAGDENCGRKIGTAAAVTAAVLFNVFFLAYAWPRMREIADGFSVLKCVGLIAAYFLYISLHELTHGAVYMLLTGQKPVIGFRPPAAYCGVPDIYTYRKTSLCSLSAPLILFSVLFAVLFFVLHDPFTRMLILFLFALHLSGCAGDLYGIGLFLFRFRSPDTLRKDTGPKQIYYTKD